MAERHVFSMVFHMGLFLNGGLVRSRFSKTLSTEIVFRVTLEKSPQKMQGRDSLELAVRGSTILSHDAVRGESCSGMEVLECGLVI